MSYTNNYLKFLIKKYFKNKYPCESNFYTTVKYKNVLKYNTKFKITPKLKNKIKWGEERHNYSSTL